MNTARPNRQRRAGVAALTVFVLAGCRGFAAVAIVDNPSPDAGARILDAGARPLDASPPPPPDAVSCSRFGEIGVCNPITNIGCSQELGMQCDVDLLASVLQGQCVFKAPPPDGGTCLNIAPTESCPPHQTCVDFQACRTLCLCDSDCEAGNCCTVPLGERGFRTCSPCE